LKYATIISYLDPKPSDIDIIEATKYNFPISIQGTMLSMQLTSIGEALDLLKKDRNYGDPGNVQ
jgi:hypothetical protein